MSNFEKDRLVREMLIKKLSFFPGLEEHIDSLLKVLTPGEISEIALTFPRFNWIFEVFSPDQLKELLAKIHAANSKDQR